MKEAESPGPHMGSKAASVRKMFSAIADRYDLLNRLLSFGRDGAWRRFAISKSGLAPGGLALDVATGTGEMVRLLARYSDVSGVVGVDFCPDMLSIARGKLAKLHEGGRVCLILGDALRLPFPDSVFDCVTIGFALRNVQSIAGAFREMARVAKPGGRVISLELIWPTSWLVRRIYHLYMCNIVPYVGGLISGEREAYKYLPQSILEFPSPQEIRIIMESVGLQRVETHQLYLGIATVHTGVKGG